MSIADAQEKIEAWRRDYNQHRPQSSLGGLPENTPGTSCNRLSEGP
jgi:transposase InsO family protein